MKWSYSSLQQFFYAKLPVFTIKYRHNQDLEDLDSQLFLTPYIFPGLQFLIIEWVKTLLFYSRIIIVFLKSRQLSKM